MAALLAFIALPILLFLVLIVAPVIMPLTIGCVIGAVICLPRAWIFMTTVSRVRRHWKQAQQGHLVDGDGMADALGTTASSHAQARALRKDIHGMTQEARAEVERLCAEEQRLSAAIEEDTIRLREEAELSALMAEHEELQLRIKTLRQRVGARH